MERNDTLRIRDYQESDFNKIAEIHDQARKIELEAANLLPAFKPFEMVYEVEEFFDYEIRIAVDDQDEPQGFIAYTSDEIAWLYVNPKNHGQGIGSLLLKEGMAGSEEIKFIEILEGNLNAKRFYEKHGFKLVEMASGQMPGNESFYVTCYILSNERALL